MIDKTDLATVEKMWRREIEAATTIRWAVSHPGRADLLSSASDTRPHTSDTLKT